MNETTLTLLRKLIRGGKMAEGKLDGLLASSNLTATKLWTLDHLRQADPLLSLGDLAGCMAFAKSNATQLVDNLEAAQLVRRVPDPRDRRCTLLEVTEAGAERQSAALEAVQPLAAQLETLFTPEEQAQFLEYLQRLDQALR